jgi:hypothetical protein
VPASLAADGDVPAGRDARMAERTVSFSVFVIAFVEPVPEAAGHAPSMAPPRGRAICTTPPETRGGLPAGSS